MTHQLTYDTLPPHSHLRREVVDGTLKIVAAAEEPGPLVRRQALLGASLPASLICFAALVVGLAIFGATYELHRPFMSQWLLTVLFIAFAIFCGALFALVFRIQYSIRMEAIERALQQTTILAVNLQRFLIETSGPLGVSSHDISLTSAGTAVRSIHVDSMDARRFVRCIQITLADGSSIRLLPGHDDAELQWVVRAVSPMLFPRESPQLTIP